MRLPPFQRLLDEHRTDVYRFLVAAVGRQDADDCFQETFLSALRAYPRLRDASNLRGWLFTIATRKTLDHWRGERRRPIPVERLPDRAAPEPFWGCLVKLARMAGGRLSNPVIFLCISMGFSGKLSRLL